MPSTPHARAALLMIGSTTFFGAMAVTIRLASDSLSTYQIAFFRNFFGLIALLPFLWRSGPAVLRTQQLPRYLVRSEEHTSELQSLMRISYAVFCLNKKNKTPSTYIKTRHFDRG